MPRRHGNLLSRTGFSLPFAVLAPTLRLGYLDQASTFDRNRRPLWVEHGASALNKSRPPQAIQNVSRDTI